MMRRSWSRAELGVIACVLVSCGGDVDLDTPKHPAGAGTGGSAVLPPNDAAHAGTGHEPGGGTGGVDDPAGVGGAEGPMTDDGGQTGAAGSDVGPAVGPRFFLIPPLAPMKDMPSVSTVRGQASAPDGSLLIGLSTTSYPELLGYPGYLESRMVMWTPAGGTQPLPFLEIGEQPEFVRKQVNICLAEDGSRALFGFDRSRADAATRDYVVWLFTPDGHIEEIPTASPHGIELRGCSADAKRAAFADACPAGCANQRLYYWQLGGNVVDVAPAATSELQVSADGASQLLLTVSVNGNAVTAAHGWSPDSGIGPALDLSKGCGGQPLLMSGDQSLLATTCFQGQKLEGVLWRNGIRSSLEAGYIPRAVSRDGSTIFGSLPPKGDTLDTLALWRGNEPMRVFELAEANLSLFSLAADGTSAFYQGAPDVRWSLDGPLVPPLGRTASEEAHAWAVATTPGPWAAAGRAGPSSASDPIQGVGVLWDANGVRDIIAELRQARIELRDIVSIDPERVWVDTAIHVQGMCEFGAGTAACIAELPLR